MRKNIITVTRWGVFCAMAGAVVGQPAVSNIRADGVGHSSLRLTWDANVKPNAARVRFGPTAEYEQGRGGGIMRYQTATFSGRDIAEVVTGLAPATQYHFCPQISTDQGKTWSECVDFTATTAPKPEIHPAYPAPPHSFPTAYPDTSGYTVRNVAADCSNLQAQINAAAAEQAVKGSVINIPAGTVCTGDYTIPTGGDIQHFPATSVNTRTSTITMPRHGFAEGQKVRISGGTGTAPGASGPDTIFRRRGIRPGDDYFIKRVDENHFQLAATPGGPAVDFAISAFKADPARKSITVLSPDRAVLAGRAVQVRSSGRLPEGLAANTTYYVINPTSPPSMTFQLAATQGGPAVAISTVGEGTQYLEDQGTGVHLITAWPPKDNWVIVRTSTPDAQFVPAGVRVSPAWRSKMAVIERVKPWRGSGEVAIKPAALAHNWRFVGIEFTHADTASSEIKTTIDPAGFFGYIMTMRDTANFILDRCYIHGLGYPNRLYRAFAFYDGTNMAVIDSYWDKLDWWHPYRSENGVVASKADGSHLSISAGTYHAGPFNATLTSPVVVSLEGGNATGRGEVYFDMQGRMVVVAPPGVSASCSGGYGSCTVRNEARPAMPLNQYGRVAGAPIAHFELRGGAIVNVANYGEPSTNVTEGAQSFIAGEGPGPFLIENNYISGTGIPIHFDDSGAGVLFGADYIVRRNYFTAPMSQLADSPESDGRRYFHRNHLEFKSGRRILIDGNVFEHNFSDVHAASGLAIIAVSGGYTGDIKVSNNIFRFNGTSIGLNGSIDTVSPVAPPVARYQFVNNLVYGIDGFRYSVHSVRPNGSSGTQLFAGYGIEDLRIEHNTLYDSRGWAPDFLHVTESPNEGVSITDNIIWLNGRVVTSEALDKNVPSCGAADKAFMDCGFIAGPGHPSYTFSGNTLIAGWSDSKTATGSKDPWAIEDSLDGLRGVDVVSGEKAIKWVSPSTGDFRLRPDSPYRAGKKKRATDGSDRGVNMDALEKAMGRIDPPRVLDITSTSARVAFTAPDEGKACYVLYGEGADITHYARTSADRTAARARAIALGGLKPGGAYKYVVLCDDAMDQPGGAFNTAAR